MPDKIALDVVVVAYRSGEDLAALERDLPVMTRLPYAHHFFENSDNTMTLTQAWNHLGGAGAAEFIAFLNTDIRLSPAWDIRMAQALNAHPEIGVVQANPVGHNWPNLADPKTPEFPLSMTYIPAPDPGAMDVISAKMESETEVHVFRNCNAPFFAVMVRRAQWEALKGFDERLRFYGQDHDFQRRILKRLGLATARVGNAPIWHRCAGSVRKSAGHLNISAEMQHCGAIAAAIVEGKLKEWDLLGEDERAAIHVDPRYCQMPLL